MSRLSNTSAQQPKRRRLATGVGIFLLAAICLATDCNHPQAQEYAEAADFARLSSEVYNENGGKPPDGWKVLDSSAHSSLVSGLNWGLYQNEDGRVALVFRGTEMTSVADWVNDLANGLGPITPDILSPQYEMALVLTAIMKMKYGDKLTLAGHSLGGGLASYAAHRFNLPAYTFNPASVAWDRLATNEISTWGGASGDKVKNFIHERDPVNTLDWIDMGSKVGNNYWITDGNDYNPGGRIAAHGIDPMADHMDGFKDCDKNRPPPGGGNNPGGNTPGTGLPNPGTGGTQGGGKAPQLDPFR